MKILLLIQSFLQNYFGTNVKFGSIKETSPQCQEQFRTMDRRTLMQMFDASAKTMNGLLQISPYHLGNFDECYNTEYTPDQRVTYGKYCLGTLSNEVVTKFAGLVNSEELLPLYNLVSNTSFGIRMGICIPDKCSAKDAEKIIGLLKFHEDWCYSKSKEIPLTFGAQVTIAIFLIVIGLVAAATICELIQKYYKWTTPKHVLTLSFISNFESLITPRIEKIPLSCFGGIKALSTMWIVLSHSYFFMIAGPLENFLSLQHVFDNIVNMFYLNGTLVVDTFLVITGIAIVYNYFTILVDEGFKFNVLIFYIRRYIRLTPLVAAAILVHATLTPYIGDGPLWNSIHDYMAEPCQTNWWQTLFYVMNWYNDNNSCVPHAWYLSVDFQLYLLSPIILILLHRKPKVGLRVLGFLIFLSCLIPFMISYIYGITMYPSWNYLKNVIGKNVLNVEDELRKWFFYYYASPFARFGPFVLGLLGGYILYKALKRKSKIVIHPVVVILLWFTAILGLAACLYGPYKLFFVYDRLTHALVMAFLRNIWAVFIIIIISMCATGYGGFINDFLSLPIFQFLSRLGYTMYLTHVGVIVVRLLTLRTPYTYSHRTVLANFLADYMITLILSIFLSLIFEIPIVKLVRSLRLDYVAQKTSEEKTEIDKTDKMD